MEKHHTYLGGGYIALIVSYLIFVVPSFLLSDSFLIKLLTIYISEGLQSLCALLGLMALFLTTIHYTRNKNFTPKKWVVKASGICYGVYVIHQFILKYFYYKTDWFCGFGDYVLPLVTFTLAIVVSIVITKLMLKTKIGRFLIG